MIQKLGPYRIERAIGRGGMGTVYAGLDLEKSQRAAIKVLSPALGGDESFRVRFKAEIETLRKLQHPHIVELYGYGEEDDHLFYAMELVDGSSLQDELSAGRRFAWREVVALGIQICSALKHAHDHGVIHRDLKPANLLLTTEGKIKLSDFGIAKLFGHAQLTGDGGVLGTADYMAPEQAQGKPATIRSDLYSLACVMYALLAGRPPFCGKSLPEVIHMVRFDEPLPVTRLASETPVELEQILNQLLRKEPAERIPTALALSHRLRALQRSLSVTAVEGERNPSRTAPAAGVTGRVDRNLTIFGTVAELKEGFDESLADRPTAPVPPTSEMPLAPSPSPTAPPTRVDHDGSHVVPAPRGAAGERERSFTTIDDQHRHASDAPTRDWESTWRSWGTALLLFVLLVGLLWLLRQVSRPEKADDVFARIALHFQREEQRALVKADARKFLRDFARDPRASTVEQYLEVVMLDEAEREFERLARHDPSRTPRSPAEELYIEAVRLRQSNRDEALERFQALVDLLHGDTSDDAKRCVELANRQIDAIRKSIDLSDVAHRNKLRERIDYASDLSQRDPLAAHRLLQGLITIYGPKPWAALEVKLASELRDRIGVTEPDAEPQPALEDEATGVELFAP